MSSKRSSSSSVAIIEGNDDLLIEILLFLPALSLVKFKLVSKRWRSLISDPWFYRLHTLHQPRRRRPETKPLFILGDRLNSKYSVCNPAAVPVYSPLPLCSELQSCNGLLLLRCIKHGRNRYYVFNPTTLQRRDLSPLPFTSVSGIYLMFDPSLSLHYRVVCFVRGKDCTRVYLYYSETHKWNLGAETLTSKMVCHNGIYFNGGICFLRSAAPSYRFTLDDNLNLSDFSARPLLRWYLSSDCIYCNYITLQSNGVLIVCSKRNGNLLDVYEMKEKENRWTHKYLIDFEPISGISNSLCVVGVIGGETLENSSFLFIMCGKVTIYRFCDAVFEELLDLEKNGYGSKNSEAHLFVPTFAPV